MADSKPFELRAGLLHLAKSILEQNSMMEYEVRKQNKEQITYNPITTDQVIAEAEKLYGFVSRR